MFSSTILSVTRRAVYAGVWRNAHRPSPACKFPSEAVQKYASDPFLPPPPLSLVLVCSLPKAHRRTQCHLCVRGSRALMETSSPEAVFEVLQIFVTTVYDVVAQHTGVVERCVCVCVCDCVGTRCRLDSRRMSRHCRLSAPGSPSV